MFKIVRNVSKNQWRSRFEDMCVRYVLKVVQCIKRQVELIVWRQVSTLSAGECAVYQKTCGYQGLKTSVYAVFDMDWSVSKDKWNLRFEKRCSACAASGDLTQLCSVCLNVGCIFERIAACTGVKLWKNFCNLGRAACYWIWGAYRSGCVSNFEIVTESLILQKGLHWGPPVTYVLFL